jgi:DeoR/GlpR family transcriptional regulator of sugar metabolism
VVTHSPVIAAALRDHSLVEVLLVGGKLFRHSLVAVGTETSESAARIRTDLFFLGATGLHPSLGATTGDWEEAAVKRAFCRAAAEVVLMVSPEKWGAAAPYQIVPAAELGVLVVPERTPEEGLEPYRQLGLEIVRA